MATYRKARFNYCETTICELLALFSEEMLTDKYTALVSLNNRLFDKMLDLPFHELVYCFKQVLLRYHCVNNLSLSDAARALRINPTTLQQMRHDNEALKACTPPMYVPMDKDVLRSQQETRRRNKICRDLAT